MNRTSSSLLLAAIFTVGFVGGLSHATAMTSSEFPNENISNIPSFSNGETYNSPSNLGLPGRREGGGTR